MKKILLIGLLAAMFVGCTEKNPDGSYKAPAQEEGFRRFGYETIVIDSCEYVCGCYHLAHKGNCKFCRKRLIEILTAIGHE